MKNREIDEKIAIELFGYKKISNNLYLTPEGEETEYLKQYTGSIYRAWEVRTKMEELGYTSEDKLSWIGWKNHSKEHPYGYSIWFKNSNYYLNPNLCGHSHVNDFNNAPKAICLAALDALEKNK